MNKSLFSIIKTGRESDFGIHIIMVSQDTERMNIDILGISELKSRGMGEFNSDGHHIYFCEQESLRRYGVALIFNKRV